MGNKLARDFKDVKLGHGQLTAANSGRNAIVPDAVVLSAAVSIVVKKDAKKKFVEFYDASSMKLLFGSFMTKGESMGSITKDSKGNVLFVSKAPNKSTRVIYRVNDKFDKDVTSSEPSSIGEADVDMSPIAKIEIDHVASCVTAFLSVKYKPSSSNKDRRLRGDASLTSALSVSSEVSRASTKSGDLPTTSSSIPDGDPSYIDVYKAVRIPCVKFGVIIVDMRGQVMGKSAHDPKEPFPIIRVAPGADASAVVALACIVNGDL
ncbi:hypothetical protein ACA910_016672 [Epithemia clementina (nom. ined.)]